MKTNRLVVVPQDFLTLAQATELKLTLRGCSKSWLVRFYDLGGIDALVDMLSTFQAMADKTEEEMQIQFELLKAVKAAMNNQVCWWCGYCQYHISACFIVGRPC